MTIGRFLVAMLAALMVAAPARAGDRTNIPLKNWGGFAVSRDAVYDDLERLVTAGLGDRVLLSTKPLSRIEAARIVARAIEKIRRDEEGAYNQRRDLEPVLARLTEEFRTELVSLGVKSVGEGVEAPGTFALVPLDRAQVFAAYASRVVRPPNNQGFTFRDGANGGATLESRLQIGDYLTFYLQPWLHGNDEFGAAGLATGYAKLTLFNVEVLVGRDSLWWGPALHGSLIMSNNAPPLDQVRVGAAEPFLLPFVGKWVGPTKVLAFMAELEERRDFKHAKLFGTRGTIAPFSFLELGISRVVQFDGDVAPRLDAGDYPRVLFSPSAGDDRVRNPQLRNNNLFAVDADLRVRNVDRYLLPARDLRFYGEFGWDDTCCRSNFIPKREAISGLAGVHLLNLLGREGLDWRFEYAKTSSLSFTHNQFYRGYWTRGSPIAHVIGTDGQELFARLTSRISPDLMIGVELDRAIIGNTLSGFAEPEERRIAGAVDVSYRFFEVYSLFAQYQIMHAENRNFRAGSDGLDHLLRLELTRSFR